MRAFCIDILNLIRHYTHKQVNSLGGAKSSGINGAIASVRFLVCRSPPARLVGFESSESEEKRERERERENAATPPRYTLESVCRRRRRRRARVCGKLNHQSNTVGDVWGAKNNNAPAICSMQLVCLDSNSKKESETRKTVTTSV